MLSEVLSGNLIQVTLRGRDYCSSDTIALMAEAELEVSVNIDIDAETVLVNKCSRQNMIISESRTIRLKRTRMLIRKFFNNIPNLIS